MTVSHEVIRSITKKLIMGDDYRIEVITLINADFLQYVISFFKKIFDAKLKDKDLDLDWYKENFINDPSLSKKELAINAGINQKTIQNMHGSSRKQIVIDASLEHYEDLSQAIEKLVNEEKDLDISLTIKFKSLSVDLSLNESLLVINALAVKRAELRGGLWSTAGKKVERPLMVSLCKLFNVPEEYYLKDPEGKFYRNIEIFRQIDFYINNGAGTFYKCEVKLMGKGNPESADAAYARNTHIFVADTLSQKNKTQFNDNRIEWVELRCKDGYKRFATVLKHLDIPHEDFTGNIDTALDQVLGSVFSS